MDEKELFEDAEQQAEDAAHADRVEHFKGFLLQDLNRSFGKDVSHLDQFNFLVHHLSEVMSTVHALSHALQDIIKHQVDESLGPMEGSPERVAFDLDVERIQDGPQA